MFEVTLFALLLQIHSTNQSAEASKYTMDEPPKASVKDMNDAPLNCKEWINEGKQQEPSAQLYESQETEHQVSQIIKAPKEENEYSRTYSKSQKEDTGKCLVPSIQEGMTVDVGFSLILSSGMLNM